MKSALGQRLIYRKGKLIFLLFVEALLLFFILYYLMVNKDTGNAIIVTITMFLALIPIGMELVFKLIIPWPVYCFAVIYTLGDAMGYCFGLYMYFSWWDDAMHCVEGFLFTMFGYYYLSIGDEGSKKARIRNLLFGISLSIFIAVIWEIIEYAADTIWLLDMQKDVFISRIDSYLLAGNTGTIGSIENIGEVTVGGRILPGYIDIGLIDTMDDLIKALAGSFVFSVYALMDRDKHPILKFENSR
ncbi:hypothetical protein BXO88_05295 [Oribacterium sp. C9]|uniref:hypothetical protein n=1 Tax=Oribacterium sp. C9 TaxID=1943579 RepID=UPI00098FD431|nr:hypothetical protein [Oribacterium sp. C9]OON86959.1 hypothetical protein BXO88_05295 [Oribacterium sp. C9]